MTAQSAPRPVAFTPAAAVVRYQTPSVDRAVAFYTQHLGFHLRLRAGGSHKNTAPVRAGYSIAGCPAVAVGVFSLSFGRLAALIAVLISLVGAVMGGRALARNARHSAVVALSLGPISLLIGALVVVTPGAGFGTGHGLGGGVIAMVLAMIGTTLGALAWVRARRTE
jgi:hypothetical protein